jgi:3-isopropylmalate/(R)-2-methylmalate dehydratase large subunit
VDTSPSATIRLRGRILYLTSDPEIVRSQLEGENLPFDAERPLRDNISTDEMTPGWACLHYDETLGDYCYAGLQGSPAPRGAVRRGGFEVVVSGLSKGCGSSRETAPFAERICGVRIVFARTIEKIYRQNAHNLGILTSTDFSLLERLARGDEVPLSAFLADLDSISREVVGFGGLFGYARAKLAGLVPRSARPAELRAMTAIEKIVAAHVSPPVVSVRAGDAVFVKTDVRFSHEYVTPMADALFRSGFGANAPLADPDSVYLFRDHLTLLDGLLAAEPASSPPAGAHHGEGASERRDRARHLADVQGQFARRHRLQLYGEVQQEGRSLGSEGICHNLVVEQIALPGHVVVGSDSHTSTAGALGCFAFGIGSTDLAFAWRTGEVRVTVPETVRIALRGQLPFGVSAKDIMLGLGALPFFRNGGGIGRALEFVGEGVRSLSIDERATLANMSVEAGAVTAIIEPDAMLVDHLVRERGLEKSEIERRLVRSDEHAAWAHRIEIDLRTVVPMVALPGDPRSAVPVHELHAAVGGDVRIDIAYGGSCTGSKKADLDAYATVLSDGLARGERVAQGVRFYVQVGSQAVRRYAEERGYLEIFRRAGAELLEPACGACIGAGPGVSTSPKQVTISAMSRNFPGRSGPGKVYLASPWVVAASAIRGMIVVSGRMEPCEPPGPMANSRAACSPNV